MGEQSRLVVDALHLQAAPDHPGCGDGNVRRDPEVTLEHEPPRAVAIMRVSGHAAQKHELRPEPLRLPSRHPDEVGPFDPVRVAGPVEPLVVGAHEGRLVAQLACRRHDLRANEERLEREGTLNSAEMSPAMERLRILRASWHEVQPSASVRDISIRLLRVHPMRAADALQLSAAVIAADASPATLEVVTLDARLASAARREGFPVGDIG